MIMPIWATVIMDNGFTVGGISGPVGGTYAFGTSS